MPALFLTVFVDMIGFGIVLPLLPFYAQRFGAEPDVVTMVVAAFTLAQFIFVPIWGRLSDRWGRRRVLLVTLSGSVIAYAAAAVAPGLIVLTIARFIGGAFAANHAVANAMVADMSTPQNRARAMGRIGAAFGLGFVAGPAIGGLLAGSDAANPDFVTPFLVASGLSAIALVMAVFMLRETLTPEMRADAHAMPRKNRFAMFRDSLARPQFGLLTALMFMMPFVFSGMESTFALWTERAFGWGPQENGYMYAFMGVAAVTTQAFLVGPLNAAMGERRLLGLAAIAACLGMLWLPIASTLPSLLAALGCVLFGVCVTYPSLNSLISQLAAPHERGTLLGVAQTSSGLARIVGPLWAGAAFANFGPDWPYHVSAGVLVVMFILSRRVRGGVPAAATGQTPGREGSAG